MYLHRQTHFRSSDGENFNFNPLSSLDNLANFLNPSLPPQLRDVHQAFVTTSDPFQLHKTPKLHDAGDFAVVDLGDNRL